MVVDAALAEKIRNLRLVVFDFDGVFTDNSVYFSQDGIEMVRCWRSDGLGLRRLEQVGLSVIVVSTEENPIVAKRCAKMKVRCIQGVPDKTLILENLCREMSLSHDEMAYLGNDINDAGCLVRVGLPMVVADAYPEVVPLARHKTEAKGGSGAVREICDLFYAVRGGKLVS
jgi:3-deoxy-D-manno-octulosonate 8-phosphate phosphatase (KDO 8-P phosphatase)